jgi:hypothetical protein
MNQNNSVFFYLIITHHDPGIGAADKGAAIPGVESGRRVGG